MATMAAKPFFNQTWLRASYCYCTRHEIETQHDDFVEKKYIILDRIFSSHTNHYISYQ